jgi:hypothetical protein
MTDESSASTKHKRKAAPARDLSDEESSEHSPVRASARSNHAAPSGDAAIRLIQQDLTELSKKVRTLQAQDVKTQTEVRIRQWARENWSRLYCVLSDLNMNVLDLEPSGGTLFFSAVARVPDPPHGSRRRLAREQGRQGSRWLSRCVCVL